MQLSPSAFLGRGSTRLRPPKLLRRWKGEGVFQCVKSLKMKASSFVAHFELTCHTLSVQ